MKNGYRLITLVGIAATLFVVPLACANAASAAHPTQSQWRTFQAQDDTTVHYRYWPASSAPKTVIQIVHGAAEHSGRYQELANVLVQHGYGVFATDHRGHGRTRVRSNELGDAGPDAWNRFVTDEGQLSQIIHASYPNADLVLLGHSLGSFIAQDYVTRYPERIDALVMSGTAYDPAAPEEFLSTLDAAADSAPLAPSAAWGGLFEDFNKPFSDEPGFEWLSRDPDVVQAYIDDPQAGFAFNNELARDIFRGMSAMRDPSLEANIPKNLPILVLAGSRDPVGGDLTKVRALLARYKELGLTNVTHHFYEGARHEVFNETNRKQVQSDLLVWLKQAVSQ